MEYNIINMQDGDIDRIRCGDKLVFMKSLLEYAGGKKDVLFQIRSHRCKDGKELFCTSIGELDSKWVRDAARRGIIKKFVGLDNICLY